MDEPEAIDRARVMAEHGVLPLYLDMEECNALWVSIELLVANDNGLLQQADSQPVSWGSQRAYMVSAARQRVPVLQSLKTAIREHQIALGREADRRAAELAERQGSD